MSAMVVLRVTASLPVVVEGGVTVPVEGALSAAEIESGADELRKRRSPLATVSEPDDCVAAVVHPSALAEPPVSGTASVELVAVSDPVDVFSGAGAVGVTG